MADPHFTNDRKYLIEIAFKVALGVIGTLALIVISQMQNSIDSIEGSISQLNRNVATVIEKTNKNEKVLDVHDERIRSLETTP